MKPIAKPAGIAAAKKLLDTIPSDMEMPSAKEIANARSIVARINGMKGGKSRSKKKLAALDRNRKLRNQSP